MAQPTGGAPRPAAGQAGTPHAVRIDEAPSPAKAMAAYRLVEGWFRAWSVPNNPNNDDLIAFPAASIQLRLNGEIIGRGTDAAGISGGGEGGGGAPAAPADDPRTVWRAALAAFVEANRRMPVDNDALRDQAVREMVLHITISLELAGPLTPLDAKTYDEAEAALAPGLDGVAARFVPPSPAGRGQGEGSPRTVAMFPGAMFATNLPPRLALSSVASQAAGAAALGLVSPAELAAKHGVRLYRFRVTHLAQTAPGDAPIFLTRAGRLIQTPSLTASELLAMADRIAEHLSARRWPGAEHLGLVGTYEPWLDASEPLTAEPHESALAAYALFVYARTPGVTPATAERARALARALIDDLAKVERDEVPPWNDPATAAMCTLLLTEDPALPAVGPDAAALFSKCADRVRACFDTARGFAADVPDAAVAVVAAALTGLVDAQAGASAPSYALADAAAQRVLADTPEADLVAQMPWLGWAEVRLAALAPPKDIPGAIALRRMRTLLWEHQLTPLTAGPDNADLVGGIVFTKAAGPSVLPTWQAARPLSFVASMLADRRLTQPAESAHELVRLLDSLRFLRQLQAGEASGWMYPNPRKAAGGIRVSLIDQRMPTDASSLTLLSVCRTLDSLHTLENARSR